MLYILQHTYKITAAIISILVAVGPNGDIYNWADMVMIELGHYFGGLSLPYYTWMTSSYATEFKEDGWFEVMKKTLKMEELVSKYSAIMNKYDPAKNIALVVDEWGTWHKVEPGTNPGFLFQQNSLRNTLVAGINLLKRIFPRWRWKWIGIIYSEP